MGPPPRASPRQAQQPLTGGPQLQLSASIALRASDTAVAFIGGSDIPLAIDPYADTRQVQLRSRPYSAAQRPRASPDPRQSQQHVLGVCSDNHELFGSLDDSIAADHLLLESLHEHMQASRRGLWGHPTNAPRTPLKHYTSGCSGGCPGLSRMGPFKPDLSCRGLAAWPGARPACAACPALPVLPHHCPVSPLAPSSTLPPAPPVAHPPGAGAAAGASAAAAAAAR
jgi:hypothetical protein